MLGMSSHSQGGADWHRLENAKKYNRPVNSFISIDPEDLTRMDHNELAIYCNKLQQIIAVTPGVDLQPLNA